MGDGTALETGADLSGNRRFESISLQRRLCKLSVPERPPSSGMHAQTAMIENGFVYIPQDAPWLAEYLHEMTVFSQWQA